jgi:hypothetical protein
MHRRALHWEAEKNSDGVFTECYMNGAFSLASIREPPEYLRSLFTGDTAEAKQFQKNLRCFNCAFAFTSVGCSIDQWLKEHNGIQPFAIHGQLSHQTGPLERVPGAPGHYARLYIVDTEIAINERMRNNPQLNQNRNMQLNRQIVERLTHMLHECQNPFIERFQTAYERLREAAATDPTVDPVTTMNWGSLPARLVAGQNTRTENVPTTSEIGGIAVDTAYSANVRDIVLRLRAPANGDSNALGLKWISQLHELYLPLHYVLFFPHGDYCW